VAVLVVLVAGWGAAAQPQDSDPGARIAAVFRHIPGLEGVEIEVADGVATLTGSVPQGGGRDTALGLAGEIPGIVHVVDALSVDAAVAPRPALMPALDKVRGFLLSIVAFLPLLAVALAILVASWFIAARIPWEAPYRRFGINPLLSTLIGQLIRVLIFLLGALLALDILGATPVVAALLGSVGLVGLALGFAFRDIVENYLAGILMSLRQPFRQHDHVQIGSHEGRVLRLTSRELVLMMHDGNHLRIPNGTVFKSPIHNYSLNPLRRFDFTVAIKLTENLGEVQRLALETLAEVSSVLAEPGPYARVDGLGSSDATLHLYGWIDQRESDIGKVRSKAIRRVKVALSERGTLPPETAPVSAAPPDAVAEREDEVSVDTQLERQIREDLSHSHEENLLEGGGD
jgi:small-conductance mechanosensitive channel